MMWMQETQTFTVATVENVTAEISTEGSSVVLTPEETFLEPPVTVTVTDGDNLTDASTFDLTVTLVNDAPIMGSFDDIVNVNGNDL